MVKHGRPAGTSHSLNRRRLLALSAFAPMVLAGFGEAGAACSAASRIVALDLPATDIVSFAGARPIGAAVASQFRDGRSDVVLPDNVVDIGHSAEPNLELLQALRPDLLVSAWPMLPTPALSRIAPVLSLPVFTGARDRYGSFANAVRAVAERRCDMRSAEAALAGAETSLRHCAARLDVSHPGPVYLVNLNGDGINLRVFGARSILGAVLLRLGVANAWTGEDGIWGWRIARPNLLREQPDANIVEITQHWDGPALPRQRLVGSPVWRDLPQVRAGRVVTLRPVAVLGGLSTGLRFAALLTEALTARAR